MVVRVLIGILVLEMVVLGGLWVPPWLSTEKYVVTTARFHHKKVIGMKDDIGLVLLSDGDCWRSCAKMAAFTNNIAESTPYRVQVSLILDNASGVDVRASDDDMVISYCTGRVVHYEYPFFQRRGYGHSVNVRLMQSCHGKIE